GAVVADVQLRLPVGGARAQLDRHSSMAEPVVDEVAERLLQPDPVAVDAKTSRRGDEDRLPQLPGAPVETRDDGPEEVVDVECLHPERESPAVGPGDQEQVVRQPRETLRLL